MPKPTKPEIEAIRWVLMSEWDPIGCGVPDDEYEAYIPLIYRLIRARVGVEELAAHLGKLETEQMDLPSRPDVNRRVAEILVGLIV